MIAVAAALPSGGAWSYGGAVLTFLFPMLLFIFIAGTLLVLYTKPHVVPGHRYHMNGRPIGATANVQQGDAGRSGASEGRHASPGEGTGAK